LSSKYINSKQFNLSPYTTEKQQIQFYFPSTGKFEHAPSNVSENLIVTSKSPMNTLNVVKRLTIKKVETFRDLMMTTNGQDNKLKVILDLFKTKEDLFFDKKFNFNVNELYSLFSGNHKFYIDAMKILRPKIAYNSDLFKIAFVNKNALLSSTDASFKKEREFVTSLIKCYFMEQVHNNNKFT